MGGVDISGPCDEAEHANDPRCAGVDTTPGGTTTSPQAPAPQTGVDISGPCDEAEHANDPRCTGAPTGDREDNSGPGNGHSGDDDGDREDNSGPGNSHSGDDDDDGDDHARRRRRQWARPRPWARRRRRLTTAPRRPAYPSRSMAGRRTILMVEDEPSITEPLAEALDREGFDTRVAGTVAEALEAASEELPDLVLLDVGLPDGSGYDVARALREKSKVPIIMLTARGEETDRIVGLELGADDYVVKPFSAREVAARIRAVLRRSGDAAAAASEERPGTLEIGAVSRWTRGRRAATTRRRRSSTSLARSSSCSSCSCARPAAWCRGSG